MATTTPERINEEIDKYTVLLSDLRAQKNSFLPIFRLPPETLANIFTHCARDYHKSNDEPTFCVPHWVNVSYVCRHWRNVALNCPALWTYHFTVSLRWTEELLARSKHASLKICIYIRSPTNRSCLARLVKKVLDHAERIQELRLDIPGNFFPTELSLNVPRLQILDIYTWDRSFEQPFMINNADTLPLRTLKLTACPLPWHSFNLSGVTTLSLCFFPRPSQQSLMEFLATLSRMPALTVLHLERAFPSARGFLSGGAFSVSPKASLPCLARLFVAAPLSTVIALLSYMDIPLKTRLRLEIGSEDSSIDDYSQIPLVVAQRFSQSKDLSSSWPTIRSLVINSNRYLSDITISASELDDCDPRLSMASPPRGCSAPLVILVGIEGSITTSDHIVSGICCSIPSTHVQTLHVIDPPSSPNFWRKTLGHLHGLRRIKLSRGLMPNLASLLALVADEPGVPRGDITHDHVPTPGHTFAPALEELELYRITLGSEDSLSGNATSKKVLLDALSTRKPLCPRLVMMECKVEIESDGDDDDDNDNDESDVDEW